MLEVGRDLDLVEEPLTTQHRGELRPEHFDGDVAVVLQVVGQVDRGHPAPAKLAADPRAPPTAVQ